MKRIFDLTVIILLAPLILPLILLLCLAVRTRIGSPIFFKQTRPGLKGKAFKIIKFRTMTNQKDENGNLLPDHIRLTAFGRFLRSTSLDELPELWNVAVGEMSLVGPRPLLMEYLPLYNERQSKRHDVRPGITGLAQINGRNAISWEEKFELDIQYVENQSLIGDIKIILQTIGKVLKREGITAEGEATMTKFQGSNNT